MCGSLLSKFKQRSSRVAPVTRTVFLERKWIQRKTNLMEKTSTMVDEIALLGESTSADRILGKDLHAKIKIKSSAEDSLSAADNQETLENDSESAFKRESKGEAKAVIVAEKPADPDEDNLPTLADDHKSLESDCESETKCKSEDEESAIIVTEKLAVPGGSDEDNLPDSHESSESDSESTSKCSSKDETRLIERATVILAEEQPTTPKRLTVDPQKMAAIDLQKEEEKPIVFKGDLSSCVIPAINLPKHEQVVSAIQDDSALCNNAQQPATEAKLAPRANQQSLKTLAFKEFDRELKEKVAAVEQDAPASSSTVPIPDDDPKVLFRIAMKKFAEIFEEKMAELQNGSRSKPVRFIVLGKTKNSIALKFLVGSKRKQTVIPSTRLPFSLRCRLGDPIPPTAEVLNAKLLRAKENRLRELERVRARARSMGRSPEKGSSNNF